jgi:hypothetical protein
MDRLVSYLYFVFIVSNFVVVLLDLFVLLTKYG